MAAKHSRARHSRESSTVSCQGCMQVYEMLSHDGRARALRLLDFRQLPWFVVRFAVELLYLIPERRAVILLRVRQCPRLTLVVPVVGRQSLSLFEMCDRVHTLAVLVKIFGQGKLCVRHRAFGPLRLQPRFQFIFAHDVNALIAVRHPVANCLKILACVDSVHSLETVVRVSDLRRPNDFSFLVDPNRSRHVDHIVELSHEMFVIYQRGELGFGCRDPRAGVFNTTGVLSDRKDFKILVLKLMIKRLPNWQIEPAASPPSPRNQQHLLAAIVRQRMRASGHVPQRKVWRFKRRQISTAFILTLAEIPDAVLVVVCDWLPDEPRELAQVEPRHRALL